MVLKHKTKLITSLKGLHNDSSAQTCISRNANLTSHHLLRYLLNIMLWLLG